MPSPQIVGTCALCLSESVLRRSHILPELLWKPVYDENEQWAVSVNLNFPRTRRIRKGFRERLLCADCEVRFGKLESKFAASWMARDPIPDEVVGREWIELSHLPAAEFKLFHLSVFWRAAVSQLPEFDRMHLGPRGERARQLLHADDPGGDDEFPLVGIVLTMPDKSTVAKRILGTPASTRLQDPIRAASAVYAGCWWHLITSRRVPAWTGRLRLQSDGRFVLPVAAIDQIPGVMDLVRSKVGGHGGAPRPRRP